jgi:hypothetical protein
MRIYPYKICGKRSRRIDKSTERPRKIKKSTEIKKKAG